MSTEADTVNLQLPFPSTEESSTIEMARSSNNDVILSPTDNRGSAKALWKAIKDRFASDESSNRARVFHEFLYVKFKEDALESYITDIKVAIKKLQSGCLSFYQKSTILSKQREPSRTAPDLDPVEGQRDARRVITIRSKTQTTRRIHAGTYTPDKAPDWWQEAQAKWQANKNVNYYMLLITLWTDSDSPRSKIVLNSGASAHIFNDTKFFDKLELGDRDVIRTGKKDATLPIKGIGRVVYNGATQ
ncbi:hypothetical protein H4Q26_005121 [Puccinia striiformis f. sp. tritici PST-130]|nr:hypothetical protein H4Q26_005121 [Puccinia striiformis f. sp. tritici PST-130]